MIGTGGCSLDVSRMEKSSHTEDILLSPAPYEHWTIMECLQQPEAIARALAFGGMGYGRTITLTGHGLRARNRLPVKRFFAASFRYAAHVQSHALYSFFASCPFLERS